MFLTLDNLLFTLCKKLILKRVKKSKFKKHKYNIQENWDQLDLILLICTIIFDLVMAISKHQSIAGIFMFAIWAILVFIKIRSLQNLKELIESYDWFWENRKHPEVYNIIKKMCSESFIRDVAKRKAFLSPFFTCVMFVLSLQFITTFSFVSIWMLFSYPLSLITFYTKYVFDFDPPEEKKTESDAKLTSPMQQQLDKLFKKFAPKSI